MLKKTINFTLVFVLTLALIACGSKYRIEREGMPEGLQTQLEEQIVAGEEMLAAAESDTERVQALLEIAFGNEQLGRFDEAIPVYKEILEIDPTHFPALNNLGAMYEEVGEYVTAAKYYGRLLEVNPSNTEALSDALRMLVYAEHFDDALTNLENFARYNKDSGDGKMAKFISDQFEFIREARSSSENQ